MRNKKKMSKLLTMLKTYIKKEKGFSGMCVSITSATIFKGMIGRDNGTDVFTVEEGDKLLYYLDNNTPRFARAYWWKKGVKKPRIDWLTEKIKELKSEGL